jgi:hypothetical protein
MLKALQQRLAPPPMPAATGPVEVSSRHLSPAVAATVGAWFRGEIEAFEPSGDRSVVIAHPEAPGLRLKIKGAGLHGKPLGFNQRHASGLKAPRFDFDGRMMEDVAAGHDNTWFGGASFQQVVVEHAVSARLNALGYATVPCLGHGQVTRQGRASWFSVFELDPVWRSVTTPHVSVGEYVAQTTAYGAQVVELASRHRLIGYYWYVRDPAGGPLLIKDVHPFYSADPINMSRLSWVMQVLFAIHIVALTTILVRRIAEDPARPTDAQAHACRGFCPAATREYHEALRATVIGPYMRGVPADFDVRRLEALLRANPISAALLERCPPEYAAL